MAATAKARLESAAQKSVAAKAQAKMAWTRAVAAGLVAVAAAVVEVQTAEEEVNSQARASLSEFGGLGSVTLNVDVSTLDTSDFILP